jgi:uncharacterized protein YcbX
VTQQIPATATGTVVSLWRYPVKNNIAITAITISIAKLVFDIRVAVFLSKGQLLIPIIRPIHKFFKIVSSEACIYENVLSIL